ncbi:MAG: MFS transporter [Chloroflexi bacterium]|nr:MFS transporter [Chloroflexota bacterium]
MSGAVTIRKVESERDFRAFFEFPWQVYKQDPHWVPPLLSMRRDLLDQKKNPDWKTMQGDYFAAWRGDQIVGTIAAYVNPQHNQANHENVGWFGAFEVYDDQEAASALLATAADWLRSGGLDAIVGPQTFTTHGDYGLLVEGFMRPVLLMPYNYSYYQKLIEGAGFHKREDLFSFHADRALARQIGLSDRLHRLSDAVTKRYKITVRPFDRSRVREEFSLFKDIYNDAWADTWGHADVSGRTGRSGQEVSAVSSDPDFAFFATSGRSRRLRDGHPGLQPDLKTPRRARRAGVRHPGPRALALEGAPIDRLDPHRAAGRQTCVPRKRGGCGALRHHPGGVPAFLAHRAHRQRLGGRRQHAHGAGGSEPGAGALQRHRLYEKHFADSTPRGALMKPRPHYRRFVLGVFFAFLLLHQADRLVIGQVLQDLQRDFQHRRRRYSLVSDYFGPAMRGKVNGLLQITGPVGSILSLVLVLALRDTIGWRNIFLLTGGLGLAVGLLILFGVRDVPRGNSEPEMQGLSDVPTFKFEWAALRKLLRRRSILPLFLQGFFGVFPFTVIEFWFFTYLGRERGYEEGVVVAIMVAAALSMSLGAITGGALGDALYRRTRRGRLLVCLIGVTAGAVLLAVTLTLPVETNPLVFGVMLAITAFFTLFSGPNIVATLYDITLPEVRSTTLAVQYFIENAGAATAPLIVGALSTQIGLSSAILLISVGTLCACAVFLLLAVARIPQDVGVLRQEMRERAAAVAARPLP